MLKKTLAVTLAVVFVLFAFASCGKKSDIVGNWKISLEFGELINSMVEDELSQDLGMDFSFDFSKIKIDIYLNIKDNGTYTISIDEDSMSSAIDDIVDVVVDGMIDALADMGVSMDDLGMSASEFRDYLAQYMDKDSLMGELDLEGSGKYKDNGTELILDGDDNSVIKYSVNGNKITVDIAVEGGVSLKGTGSK
ncbi:MAG: hypothetical protein J1F61_06610 [Clostridiales bacterium]|nr:hypothetical protein [Clostridiales bacterium]